MALTVTSATARVTSSTGTATSASFAVTTTDLIIVCIGSDSTMVSSPTLGVTDTGANAWTSQAVSNQAVTGNRGAAAIYTMTPSVSRSITVSATSSSAKMSAQVYKVTGQDSSPFGATGAGGSTTDNLTASIFTSTADNSVAIVSADEWNQFGPPTSSDLTLTTYDIAGFISGCSGFKALGVAGAETANLNSGGATPLWNWCALEIHAAPPPAITVVSAAARATTGNGVASITTAAFTPAAGETLFVCFASDGNGAETITDSLGGSWTLVIQSNASIDGGDGQSQTHIYRRTTAATAVSMTVTGAIVGGFVETIKVYRVAGAGISTGATGHGISSTRSITPAAFTSTVDSSVMIAEALNFASSVATPTSTDLTIDAATIPANQISILSGFKQLGAIGPQTFNATEGSGVSSWRWVAAEITSVAVAASGQPNVSAISMGSPSG